MVKILLGALIMLFYPGDACELSNNILALLIATAMFAMAADDLIRKL